MGLAVELGVGLARNTPAARAQWEQSRALGRDRAAPAQARPARSWQERFEWSPWGRGVGMNRLQVTEAAPKLPSGNS